MPSFKQLPAIMQLAKLQAPPWRCLVPHDCLWNALLIRCLQSLHKSKNRFKVPDGCLRIKNSSHPRQEDDGSCQPHHMHPIVLSCTAQMFGWKLQCRFHAVINKSQSRTSVCESVSVCASVPEFNNESIAVDLPLFLHRSQLACACCCVAACQYLTKLEAYLPVFLDWGMQQNI